MLRNYLLVAFRNLSRHKGTSIINIAGLMVGFTAFILIFLVTQYEQSFDNFHPLGSSIYRIDRIGKNTTAGEFRAGVPFPVTSGMRNDISQIANASAIFVGGEPQVFIKSSDGSVKKKFTKSPVYFAEPQFFQMFNFPLAEGSMTTALKDPQTVLLTKDAATKYFGDWKGVIGKLITLDKDDFKVTGILENPPTNTDFPLSIVASYATFEKNFDMTDWGSISDENYCFIQIRPGYSPKQFDKLLKTFVDKHIKAVNPNYDLVLQPLSEIHYDSRYGNFNGRTFSKDLVLALNLIALFLMVIACVNFINLTTAQAINRAREVGVRKVLGSSRGQLVFQFLGETGVTCLLALIGSAAIAFLCLPAVNTLLDVHISTAVLYSSKVLLFMLGVLILVTFLSGFYPSLILSGFNSAKVLKSAVNTDNQKGVSFRRALVVFQFVIAQALIIGTLIVISQMDYFNTADMGFNKKSVLYVGLPGDSLSRTKYETVKNELTTLPGVENLSMSTFTPIADGGWHTDLKILTNHTNTPDMIVSLKPADTGYFRLYDLPIVAGRIYFASDTAREIVVNETVIKRLGIQKADAAIGKIIEVNGSDLPIVGVVKDFHVKSLRDPIDPVVLTTMKGAYGLINIRFNVAQLKSVVAGLSRLWNQNFPDNILEYNFIDQSIADYYKQENQLAQLYKIFACIAIFISCLGLYGLISFMAIKRRKEIGIRKVLGAPVRDIVIMLSKEFTILIVVAFLIASPIAWYFMHQWLQQYTYRILMGAGYFIATIIGSLLIAWFTVGYTAIKAAVANPVKSLRTE